MPGPGRVSGISFRSDDEFFAAYSGLRLEGRVEAPAAAEEEEEEKVEFDALFRRERSVRPPGVAGTAAAAVAVAEETAEVAADPTGHTGLDRPALALAFAASARASMTAAAAMALIGSSSMTLHPSSLWSLAL